MRKQSANAAFKPACGSLYKITHTAAVMPETAIYLIYRVSRRILSIASCKRSNYSNNLIVPYAFLRFKLIVAYTRIRFAYHHRTVKNILSVISAVQRNVIFFQLCRRCRQLNAVNSLPYHRKHTDTAGGKSDFSSRVYLFFEYRHKLIKRYKA